MTRGEPEKPGEDVVDERTIGSWPGEAQAGRAGDLGAGGNEESEEAKDDLPGGLADVARSQMPDQETNAERQSSQAGADSIEGLASHRVDPFNEETEVEG